MVSLKMGGLDAHWYVQTEDLYRSFNAEPVEIRTKNVCWSSQT